MPFLNTPYLQRVKSEVNRIAHLPLLERITHRNARRPLIATGAGVVMMFVGSVIVSHKEDLHHLLGGHHIVFDTLGLFLHGVGAVPLMRYIEPVWLILLGAAEQTGEAAVVAGAALATTGAVAMAETVTQGVPPLPAKKQQPKKGEPNPPFRASKRRKNGRRK